MIAEKGKKCSVSKRNMLIIKILFVSYVTVKWCSLEGNPVKSGFRSWHCANCAEAAG